MSKISISKGNNELRIVQASGVVIPMRLYDAVRDAKTVLNCEKWQAIGVDKYGTKHKVVWLKDLSDGSITLSIDDNVML